VQLNNDKNQDELVQRRREQIITAARKVFAQKGYQGTKTEDIAAALGVGKGTLYRYFKDKKDLFVAVDDEGFKRLDAEIEQKGYPIEDPRERLKAILRCFFEFFDSNPDLVEIGMQMRSEFKDIYELRFTEGHNQHMGRLTELMREGMAKGYFRDADPVMAAKALSALAYGTLLQFYYRRTGERLSDYIQPITDFVMLGMLKQGGSGQNPE
jgi:AcrR family transcriptional regulator